MSANVPFYLPPYIHGTWVHPILKHQLFASGLHTDDHFFTSEDDTPSTRASSSSALGMSYNSPSVHSVRLASDTGSSGSRKVPKTGGLFARVDPTEQARDLERMNAEVYLN